MPKRRMTGSALAVLDVGFRVINGGEVQEGWCPDDGKRLDSLSPRWTLQMRAGGKLGGSLRGGSCEIFPGRRLADDGKRLDSLSPRWTL